MYPGGERVTITELNKLTGGLSRPSKMPCYSFSLPAAKCLRGAELAKVKGTVCSTCYALKGRYRFPTVRDAQQRRFKALMDDSRNGFYNWSDWMTELIDRREHSGFFRWHDSGDLQSVGHLKAIIRVAEALVHIRFWLPTRELKIVKECYVSGLPLPLNLTIRLSRDSIGDSEEQLFTELLPTSSVSSGIGWTCQAPHHQGQCNSCRACWEPRVKNVDYALH